MLFNVLLYAVMVFMVIRMIMMNKNVNRRRKVINVINQIQDEQAFYAAANEVINTVNDPIIETKTRIIRLWGMVYHKNLDRFEEELNDINIRTLFLNKNGNVTIEADEDSFFYLLLSLPNMLYGMDRVDLIDKIYEKVNEHENVLSNQLIKALGDHCNLFYHQKDDLGEAFFRKIDEGDYPGYRYSKQLIGVYKNICDTMLCKILADRNEDYSEFEIYAENFAKMGVGRRWIEVLGLDIKAPSDEIEEETENTEEEVVADEENDQNEAEVIDVTAEEPETEEVQETDKEEE